MYHSCFTVSEFFRYHLSQSLRLTLTHSTVIPLISVSGLLVDDDPPPISLKFKQKKKTVTRVTSGAHWKQNMLPAIQEEEEHGAFAQRRAKALVADMRTIAKVFPPKSSQAPTHFFSHLTPRFQTQLALEN